MTGSVAVVIIEPNPIFRTGLIQVLRDGGFRNCFGCESVQSVASALPSDFSNVLILASLGNEEEEISAGMEEIGRLFPSARVVLFSDTVTQGHLSAALKTGMDGMVPKFVAPNVLIKSVELVLLGQPVFPAEVVNAMRNERPAYLTDSAELRRAMQKLSGRELEVLRCMCMGHTNKVIARSTGITEATVKVHVKAILRKLSAHNRTEAALLASGYFNLEPVMLHDHKRPLVATKINNTHAASNISIASGATPNTPQANAPDPGGCKQ